MSHKPFHTALTKDFASLYSAKDWNETSLGPYEKWPSCLKVHLHSILSSEIPQYLCWGPNFLFFYNEAYAPMLSKRHPSLGEAFEKVWPEIWSTFQEHFREVMGGRSYSFQDQSLQLERHGYPEIGYFSYGLNPIFDEQGKTQGVHCICHETTDTVLSQKELVFARESAEQANSAKSAFLANMSHEIRTPLGAIMGFVELLRDDISESEREHYLGVIERNSQQLLRLIDDILDLSKVEAGRMMIEWMDFSLVDLIADFSSLMGFKAKENGIDFIVKAKTPLPSVVNSDPTRIKQILNNVVGNAIKFTSKGVVTLTISYVENQLEFHVEDTGLGISMEEADKLFHVFVQADISTTRKFGGTGLGLVLTKKLSEALEGDFWLEESELGKGSIFISRIKVERSTKSQWVRPSGTLYSTRAGQLSLTDEHLFDGVRVLVVDDSPDSRTIIHGLLKKLGARVQFAENGISGVSKALHEDFDFILMDVKMPEMNGIEAVRILRDRDYPKPIIALTSQNLLGDKERCLENGFTGFLSKPVDREKLVEIIKAQIHRSL